MAAKGFPETHYAAVTKMVVSRLGAFARSGAVAKTGKTRGRLILNATEASADFVVSRMNGQESTWALEPHRHYWYGDYQTAWGYEEKLPAGAKSAERTFHYFPMWIEPNRTVGVAHLTIDKSEVMQRKVISAIDAVAFSRPVAAAPLTQASAPAAATR